MPEFRKAGRGCRRRFSQTSAGPTGWHSKQGGTFTMTGFVLPKTNGLMEVPLSRNVPVFLLATGLTVAAAWCNNTLFTLPASRNPHFLAEQARIGNVTQRTEAPPVFLNPISRGIPGNIIGPADLQ